MSAINYSQCWEDTNLLKQALKITNEDVVLSVTSGGDNTLALLMQKPKTVFFIDINPVQGYVAELKLQATKILNYEQYLDFLGVNESRTRIKYYNQISTLLSSSAHSWFLANMNVIENGVIHSGKFEKYLNSFRRYLLPLVHSQQIIKQFVNHSNLNNQINFYKVVWNTWRWKFFFTVATNSSLLRNYARQAGSISKGATKNESYYKRMERLVYRTNLKTNFYLQYALTGKYGESLPDYLVKENYAKLQECGTDRYKIEHKDLLSFLKKTSHSSLTKYNLSDTFEFLSTEEAVRIWREIVRTAKNGAKVVYWCNQIEHVPPYELAQQVVRSADLENELTKQDRLYFYQSFHIYTIIK